MSTLPTSGQQPSGRLYKELALSLIGELASGRYRIGQRLPPERELATTYKVSRPTVREAIISLEVEGLVEVRVGSGVYVRRLPGKHDHPGGSVSAIEITEARMLIEGEAAALAAIQISPEQLAELDHLLLDMADENLRPGGGEKADQAFHVLIARATRNGALVNAVEELWRLRSASPESALLHAKARTANIKPVVDEHRAVVMALHAHDASAARGAMQAHLHAVLESLLFATEEAAIARARETTELRRERFARVSAR